jgi:tetratricopeptide (TPR) repeat protein
MHGDATGRGNVYQAAQSITINYGEGSNVRQASEARQAAVVVQLSAAGEDREGVFVGRDQLIAGIMTRLDPAKPSPADTVISVISGLAGVGKTALARHTAALALDRGWFTAAVFADFHGYDPDSQARVVPTQLFASILRTLGVSPNQIPISGSEQAADYHSMLTSMAAAGQRVLLVFDNVSSSGQVNELLPETRAHRVLITSRHILGDIGNVGILELDILPPGEAIEVLTEALRERHAGDLRISQRLDEAGELARLCGYLPLALRISGALLAEDPALPVSDLVGDLQDAKTRLEGLVYGELAVSATFDLSWRQLFERDTSAAQLFVELPINPGPEISSEAAAALVGQPGHITTRLLRVLRRCHLIELGTTADRWHMHDLLRLYADKLRQLDCSYDHAAASNRLLRYYLARSEAASDQLLDPAQKHEAAVFADRDEVLTWLDLERPNLTASVLLAEDTGWYQSAVDLALAISPFLRLRRHFADYVVTSTACVRAAGLLGDPRREAMAVSNLGLAPQEVTMTDHVLTALRAEYVKYRASGDRSREAWALASLGTALAARGTTDEVIVIAQEVSRLFGELGDHQHEAWSLTMLGLQLQIAGRTSEAIAAHQRARAVFQQIQDHNGEAWSLTNLGASLRAAQRFNEAIDVGQQANEIFREVGDRSGEGASLVNCGIALLGLRQFDKAVQAVEEACTAFQAAGDLQREAGAMNSLGLALRELGRREEAITAHERANAKFREIGDRKGEALSLTLLGAALLDAGMIDEARRQWQRASDVYQMIGANDDAERVRRMVSEPAGDFHAPGNTLPPAGRTIPLR